MSIKIFDGYIIPNMNQTEFQEWISPFIEAVQELTTKHVYQVAIDRATYWYDLATLSEKEEFENRSSVMDFYDPERSVFECVMNSLQKESESIYRIDIDIKSFLKIFKIEGKTLAILVYGDVTGVKDAFEELPGIQNYDYWNHTEKPLFISDEDWHSRETDWKDALFVGDETQFMLISELPTDFSGIKDVSIPTVYNRAEKTAKTQLSEEIVSRLDSEELHSSISKLVEYLESPIGKSQIKERTRLNKQILSREVSIKTFDISFSDLFQSKE